MNMARLIDADALERSFRDMMEPDVPTYLNVITGMIKAMPTVDAEPVVRCKDCWKCGYDNCPMDDWLDTHWIDYEFFCSFGEPYEMRPGLYRGVKMDRGEKDGKAD